MNRAFLLLFCVGWMGCADKPSTSTVEDTQPQTITVETGVVVDTADSGQVDTGEVDPLVSIALYPADLVVHPGASFALRALGTWQEGEVGTLAPIYESADEAIATVDASGVVTAVSAGSVTLSANQGAVVGSVNLTVADDGMMQITVVAAADGAPLAGMRVKVGEGDVHHTDKLGHVSVPVADGSGVQVSAYDDGTHVPATIWSTVSRDVTLPLHRTEQYWAENARLEGSVDFSDLEADGGELTIGLVVPSFQHGPLLIEPRDLMAEHRTVSLYGVKTDLPANLAIQEHAEGYVASTPAQHGDGAVWVIGGALPIGDIIAALNEDSSDTEGALSLLGEHIDALRWDWNPLSGLQAGHTATTSVQPQQRFSEDIVVSTGSLPGGFAGTERPLVMTGSTLPEGGVVVTGLALGTEDVVVPSVAAGAVDGSTGQVAMAVAQVGGLGSGGALSSSWGPVVDGVAHLSSYQNTSYLEGFDAISHELSMWTDPLGTYVQIELLSKDGSHRLIYLPSGQIDGVLSNPGFTMGYGVLNWQILSLETVEDTFEGMVRRGDLVATSLATRAWRSTLTTVQTQASGH